MRDILNFIYEDIPLFRCCINYSYQGENLTYIYLVLQQIRSLVFILGLDFNYNTLLLNVLWAYQVYEYIRH